MREVPVRAVALLFGLALLLALPSAFAQDIQYVLSAAKDSFLIERPDIGDQAGAGAQCLLFAGHVGMNQPADRRIRRPVFQFDIMTDLAAPVLAGFTINNTQVRLFVEGAAPGVSTNTLTFHKLTSDWQEGIAGMSCSILQGGAGEPCTGNECTGDVTWFYRNYNSQTWTTAGGDFDSTVSSSIDFTNLVRVFTTSTPQAPEMISDVTSWANGSSPNYGFLLREDFSATDSTARKIWSRESTFPPEYPSLIVDLVQPGGFGSCCVGNTDPLNTCRLVPNVAACTALGGTFANDASCYPGTAQECPQVAGACCALDGSCTQQTYSDCYASSAVFSGLNTSCIPNECPAPVVACCYPDATCIDEEINVCLNNNGTAGSIGSVCEIGFCEYELTPFQDELPIPPTCTMGPNGYDISMVEFETQLHSELPNTLVWGYNCDGDGTVFPGVSLETTSGEAVTVTFHNEIRNFATGEYREVHPLPVELCLQGPREYASAVRTVVHLHGTHSDARSDGYPEYSYFPGEGEIHTYPNNQRATMLWFHDHAMGTTEVNSVMGLAGAWFIRDDVENNLGLPSGQYEVPLVLFDRSFTNTGAFASPLRWKDENFGHSPLVNGKVTPFLEVEQGMYRFRLLNGAASRFFKLRIENATMNVIGNDGGLLAAPVLVNGSGTILLAPAERLDVLVDFSGFAPGTNLRLLNSAEAPFGSSIPTGPVIVDVMEFRVVGGGSPPSGPVPATLDDSIMPIPVGEASRTRQFELHREDLTGCVGLSKRFYLNSGFNSTDEFEWQNITEFIELGDTEIWEFHNAQLNTDHPIHLHLVQFQILGRMNGTSGSLAPPKPEEAGWKDTVVVPAQKTVRVIARFEDYVGKFPYHCHMLSHEDNEMMRQFRVVNTGCDNNGVCGEGEDCISCPNDCAEVIGARCGNLLCEIGDGEDCLSCPEDCLEPTNGTCCGDEANPACAGSCAPSSNFFCRDIAQTPACCGDGLCEGLEAERTTCCRVDCEDAYWPGDLEPISDVCSAAVSVFAFWANLALPHGF